MKTLAALVLAAAAITASTAAACDTYCQPTYSSYGRSYGYGYQSFHSLKYSDWSYSDKGYNYAVCQYQPYKGAGYQSYVCVNYPSYSQYTYYYSPAKKSYWARYDHKAKGFQTLPAEEQKATVAEINEGAFTAPAAQANIPDSTVGEQLSAPPVAPQAETAPVEEGLPTG